MQTIYTNTASLIVCLERRGDGHTDHEACLLLGVVLVAPSGIVRNFLPISLPGFFGVDLFYFLSLQIGQPFVTESQIYRNCFSPSTVEIHSEMTLDLVVLSLCLE